MNELQIFNSEEFGEIRTVTIDNEPSYHNCKFINSLVLKLKFKYITKIIVQDIINFIFFCRIYK